MPGIGRLFSNAVDIYGFFGTAAISARSANHFAVSGNHDIHHYFSVAPLINSFVEMCSVYFIVYWRWNYATLERDALTGFIAKQGRLFT